MLQIESVSMKYGRQTVLENISLQVPDGQCVSLIGESGSGKTTLISLLSALDKVQSGSIKFNGKSIKKIGEGKFRLSYVNIVFQSYNLIKYMTARENVQIALDFENISGNRKEKSYELLKRVGLGHAEADRLVNKLSGGQQQRVAIARAMAGDTPIVVADEPTGNLDERTEAKILELFHALAESGKIVIIVTHSQKVAKHAKAIVYHMQDGLLKKK